MKSGHLTVRAGTVLLAQESTPDTTSAGPYTLYDGWAMRYRQLTDGRRQIYDFLLPGDLFGLQAAALETSRHAVVTITSATVCALHGRPLRDLIDTVPDLAMAAFGHLTVEERRADARLEVVAKLEAPQRVGYLMLEISDRLTRRRLTTGRTCPFPLQKQQIGDALGISRNYVRISLEMLEREGLARIAGRRLTIFDRPRLEAFVGEPLPPPPHQEVLI